MTTSEPLSEPQMLWFKKTWEKAQSGKKQLAIEFSNADVVYSLDDAERLWKTLNQKQPWFWD